MILTALSEKYLKQGKLSKTETLQFVIFHFMVLMVPAALAQEMKKMAVSILIL